MEEDSIRLPAHLRECLRAPGTGKDRLTDGQAARGTAGSEGLTEQGQGAGPQAGEGQALKWFSRDFAKLLCSLSPPPQHGFENLEISPLVSQWIHFRSMTCCPQIWKWALHGRAN